MRRPMIAIVALLGATLVATLVAPPMALLGLAACAPAPCEGPLVFAASDLQSALPELADTFATPHGCRPTLVFGSTGAFTTQLENGAAADVFFAANEAFLDRLEARDLLLPGTRARYALGRLALVAPPGRPAPTSLEVLREPSVRFVALANPAHAPYGVAAEQVLRASGHWEPLEGRRVLGENVSQTWQMVNTGNADYGLVALAAVHAVPNHPYLLVDDHQHAPLIQAAAVPASAKDPAAGRAFLQAVRSPAGQAALARHGFRSPPE